MGVGEHFSHRTIWRVLHLRTVYQFTFLNKEGWKCERGEGGGGGEGGWRGREVREEREGGRRGAKVLIQSHRKGDISLAGRILHQHVQSEPDCYILYTRD